jgi:hypothetical protein
MSEFRPSKESRPPASAARCNSVHERTLLGLVLITLFRTSEALAGDEVSISAAAPTVNPLIAASARSSTPASAQLTADPVFLFVPKADDLHVFSATEFFPRKHTVFDREPPVGDAPMLRGTTVWQRLDEYRVHDGVRLLTLWESRGSTVSLQAGKRGDPSLQWSSRLTSHGGTTRGLLDQLFSVSIAGAGSTLRNATHAVNSSSPVKPPATAVAVNAATLK